MTRLSVCLLTHNSLRTLAACLEPALQVADEMIVVDSGSTDGTLEFLTNKGVVPIHRPYETHASQMNFAIEQAGNDWVLCLDSDEFMDMELLAAIQELKSGLDDPGTGYRIQRYWQVLGREVRAIYPVSSPDKPLRLFNRTLVHFNDQPVDDKASGPIRRVVLPGRVVHDTFFSIHEVFGKLNGYTSRLVQHRSVPPSLLRAVISPPFAFLKWYFRKGAWRDGAVGIVTAAYAALYSFLKYFKSWCRSRRLPLQ
ncbi:MAG: glycosyltransferase family 2 protein [Azovibrio sp.]